jgi:hypothetical protein
LGSHIDHTDQFIADAASALAPLACVGDVDAEVNGFAVRFQIQTANAGTGLHETRDAVDAAFAAMPASPVPFTFVVCLPQYADHAFGRPALRR